MRSRSVDHSAPARPSSPRRQLYEAKFEKYLTNKGQKQQVEARARAVEKEPFDTVTKGAGSPSKHAGRFGQSRGTAHPAGQYEAGDLIPDGYEEQLMRAELLANRAKDPFAALNVSAEDKMTFFLLKWVFNAIKQDGGAEGGPNAGSFVVGKSDLVKQLVKNREIMSALELSDTAKLERELNKFECARAGELSWTEFLNFFFLKDRSLWN